MPKELGQEAGDTPGWKRRHSQEVRPRKAVAHSSQSRCKPKAAASQGRRGSVLPSKQSKAGSITC